MEFVPLSPETFSALTDLFLREKGVVRPHQREEHLNWTFLDVPHQHADAPVVEIALEDGRILGCMGAVPNVLLVDGQAIPFASYVDWLVDSSQRRRKIGSKLIRRANSRFPVAIHLGSTPEGYAACATLGAIDCGRTLSARRILNPRRWAVGSPNGNVLTRAAWTARTRMQSRRLPPLRADGLTVESVIPIEIDGALSTLSHQLSTSYACTLRDGERWHWLLNSPLYTGYALAVIQNGACIGYAACVIGQRSQRIVGTVADMCIGRIEDAPLVLRAALVDLARQGVDGIEFTVSEHVGRPVAEALGMAVLRTPMMGAWLQEGYEHIPDKPLFMTMAENLSITGGIDFPINKDRLPVRRSIA
jgi:hypothetical protein